MNRFVRCVGLAGVLAAIATARLSAETRWTMVRTPTLTVIGDQSAGTLRDIAVQLEQFRAVVGGLIHNADRPPALPTTVYVFGTRRAMQPYLPISNGKVAALAGYFQRDNDTNTIAMSLERMDESSAVAYHEYTHLLVNNAVRGLPVWLSEGLAEYYSTYRLTDGGREAQIGRPPEGRLAMLREDRLPLANVIAVDHSSALYNESNKRSMFYAESWAMTHYLLTQMPNGGQAINKYAGELMEGRTANEAFFNAFGASPAEFDMKLRAYVQRTQFAGTKFTFPEKVAVPETSEPRTLSGPESNAWLGDLQRRLGRDAEAAPRIDAAVAADPELGITHLAAGLLRFAQQRTSEGLLELERAAALSPDDFLTQYLYGVWMLREDLTRTAEDSGLAAQVLAHAAALKPESSDAYAWLAYAQMQRDETLSDARRSIEHAIELAPGRADHRLRWADVRMLQGGYDDARKLLTAIAAIRYDPRAADGAQQRLDRLAEFEAGTAASRRAGPGNAEVPADGKSGGGDGRIRIRVRLRQVQPGEKRLFGRLVEIECAVTAARFHVDVNGEAVVTEPSRLEDIEMISYLGTKDFTLGCGSRPEPDIVYLTTRDGVTVALEFLPKGYVP